MFNFSSEEQSRLSPYFTNMHSDIFGLKLPQEVAGALFSRYSRSNKSLRKIFLDEFLGKVDLDVQEDKNLEAVEKAREFYDRVLIGYGDDSVAQLGGAHLACENVSNVAAKTLEDSRIGIAPLEKSTRYVKFDTKDENGEYLFYKEPSIMISKYKQEYLDLMNKLFDTYSSLMSPMIEHLKTHIPIESISFREPKTGDMIGWNNTEGFPELRLIARKAYQSSLRSNACDILRSFLPAATLTNVGLFGVGQAFEHLLNKLFSTELAEMHDIALSSHSELKSLIPSFVKRVRRDEYLVQTESETKKIVQLAIGYSKQKRMQSNPVTLIDFDEDAENKIISAIVFSNSNFNLEQIRYMVDLFSLGRKQAIFDSYVGHRETRRDKPGRALENTYYTFDLIGNLGIYRDLHRHRILTQERQRFTTVHGYDTPIEIEEAGFKGVYDECMEQAHNLHTKLVSEFPNGEAQYVVPFAYKTRWYMKTNLRELLHIAELRTTPQGHPDYRIIVQNMWRKIEEVHPMLATCGKFVDWNTYKFGRLQSEMKSEYKKTQI